MRSSLAFVDIVGLQAVELLVDFPAGASVEPGAIAGLAGAIAVMGGSGDYSVLRGAPAFPRLH